jgi:FtsZ-binding cell division protein ZapB
MEPDSLATLEERIRSAVEVVTQLRRDKDAALQAAAEVEPLRQRIAVLTAELDTTKSERDTLKSERENVRRRVEKLLEQIDALGAG